MDRETMEKVTAAYTVYSLLSPADRIVISINSFAEIYKTNLAALDTDNKAWCAQVKAAIILKGAFQKMTLLKNWKKG